MMKASVLALALVGSASAFSPSALSTVGRRPALGAGSSATRPLRPSALGLKAKLGALLFDCDGVLADTERDGHRIAFNIAFKEFGLKNGDVDMEWDEELYGKLVEIGGGKERMMGYWEMIGYKEGDWELAKKIHERKTALFSELIQAGKIPLRPGVTNLVEQALDAGVPVAVCSTSNEKAVAQIVAMMGPEKATQIPIFAGDCVPRKKPSPDIYNLAKDTLKVKPEDCVVIEDSAIGLAAAKAADMACIVTKSTYTKNEVFQSADVVVDDLESANIDLISCEGIAASSQFEDWGIDRDIQNAGVGRGRW